MKYLTACLRSCALTGVGNQRMVYVDKSVLEKAADRIEELESALVEERLENLWNAYNTGFEKDGQWSHSFMSQGEWLAEECGFDPSLGWYDANEVKEAIPQAARAALKGAADD